jgi:hypothetical protein
VYLNHTEVRDDVKRQSHRAIAPRQRELSSNYPFLECATKHILHHGDIAASTIPQNRFLS